VQTAPKQQKEKQDLLEVDLSRCQARGTSSAISLQAARAAELGGLGRLNMVVIGHVDAGKSTLMGHLLYLKGSEAERLWWQRMSRNFAGQVSQKQLHKFEQESKAIGKGSFHFAWILDEHEAERYMVAASSMKSSHDGLGHAASRLM